MAITAGTRSEGGAENGEPLPRRPMRWRVPGCTGNPPLRLVAFPAPHEIEEIVAFFERVAEAERWQPEGELRAHVTRSTYFGLWQPPEQSSHAPKVVGGLQLVSPDASGALPCQRVWPELPGRESATTAHIAMLAVDEGWRGKAGGLFWQLTAAMWNHCVRTGITTLYLEATPRTLRCYERFGWPLTVRGDLREHWGEPVFPCALSVREVGGALAERAVRSDAYRRILADMVGIAAGSLPASAAASLSGSPG